MSRYHSLMLAVSTATLVALGGCGGGGGDLVSGIGGTGVTTASGTITAFGSIFVNGIEFDIDSASCTIDDNDHSGACQNSLRLGMVVTVTGTVIGDQGVARSVIFNGDVEGPVSGIVTGPDGLTRSFSVLGTPVIIERAVTAFDDVDFDTLADGNLVEVSGFYDAGNQLRASFLGKKSDSAAPGDKVEVKGTVSGAPGSGAGHGQRFMLNGLTVNIGNMSETDMSKMPGSRVSNGDLVQVKGTLDASGQIDATRIKPEHRGVGDEGEEISIEGLVAGYAGSRDDFTVNGQRVDASKARLDPPGLQLANGMRVEVEGTVRGEVLVADKLEARGNGVKIHARVSDVNGDLVTLRVGDGSLTVRTDNRTRMEDETGAVRNMRVSDINPGDFLEIRAFADGGGIAASELSRNAADDVILQGPVDSTDPHVSVTILGITFFVDSNSEYDDENDGNSDASRFFDRVRTGDLVKIRDSDGDGTADEVDMED